MEHTSPDRAATAPLGPPPPFDPELATALAAIHELMPPGGSGAGPGATPPEDVPGMRPVTNETLERDGAFRVEERSVPGPAGAPDVSLLICRLADAATPVPALYHIHGGGMTVGDNRTGVPEMLDLAQELRLSVVSVEYRLAPGTRHPGPVEDCYAGLVWTAEHAAELGIDRERVIVVGGSAGGGLAAAVALLARDRGGPALLGQVLMCPMIDDRNDTPSARQMTGVGVWDRAANEAGWTALLGAARGTDDVSPYAAPARAADLSGLPPAFVDVASAETFRDEDVDYARRIWQAGGEAELHVWTGGFHGFDSMAPQAAISRDAWQARLRWLRRLLAH
ncbi:alpha/beta hydrolase [Streptomyces malaysiensis subsp. malaysiensis]|uniref:Alpha/beta hydrolase fold domain-containing protein n=1 Tax=Streptomyces malaysiensis TaxID=92644 RepID=A0ABX6W0D2_STRMQ|nr:MULTISPECIES: alpha/beta hydrolase fold domain-containing protein [Streptomyces]QPI54421.1 alpha/beta hydrolase fold domain-containing protein [Streptomyces solisilvae]UHH15815.1 alpha/beta hydrolase [Streptomyces sp. HNM0561]